MVEGIIIYNILVKSSQKKHLGLMKFSVDVCLGYSERAVLPPGAAAAGVGLRRGRVLRLHGPREG